MRSRRAIQPFFASLASRRMGPRLRGDDAEFGYESTSLNYRLQEGLGMKRLLIANRGEIAIRIARAAADMGLPTVAIHSEDDAASLHLRAADDVFGLKGQGAAAYLDMDKVIGAAKAADADAIHPGYGFLAERADFAKACADAGLTFI